MVPEGQVTRERGPSCVRTQLTGRSSCCQGQSTFPGAKQLVPLWHCWPGCPAEGLRASPLPRHAQAWTLPQGLAERPAVTAAFYRTATSADFCSCACVPQVLGWTRLLFRPCRQSADSPNIHHIGSEVLGQHAWILVIDSATCIDILEIDPDFRQLFLYYVYHIDLLGKNIVVIYEKHIVL